MRINAKPPVIASRGVARVIDTLSKSTLADIVVDRIRLQVGEDASEPEILACLQQWLFPVALARGDKEPNLLGIFMRREAADARYILEHAKKRNERR